MNISLSLNGASMLISLDMCLQRHEEEIGFAQRKSREIYQLFCQGPVYY